ncbi:hypothetical protein CBR_g17599 [Chara braunii]|uniref:DDE Tnp4 domain-containing protein n=1 Tax=Chara braunii TaxID=69332 RepID=A0A388KV18_CHABU|nr:hypothetical protein CBR_g17599 [Chara braunii]|eukprot:GBG73887.1 hypothetical protein CBR_g17599 [Chara braunii]
MQISGRGVCRPWSSFFVRVEDERSTDARRETTVCGRREEKLKPESVGIRNSNFECQLRQRRRRVAGGTTASCCGKGPGGGGGHVQRAPSSAPATCCASIAVDLRAHRLRVALRVRARGCERRKGAIFSTDVFGTIVQRGRTRQTAAERRAMEGGAPARRDALSHGELQAVAAAVSTIQQERALGRLKEHLRARRRRTLTQDPHDGAEFVATSEAVVQLCYALGCGVIPRATPRWWVKRRTGGTWEDLRLCDDATDDYFRDKLRMSPRVFREIAEACVPHLQLQVTFYREPLQPDQIVAYALYRRSVIKVSPTATVAYCTHIYVDKPANAPSENYYDRKRRFSIVAQVVVDLDLCVLDVHMGYPGSCHDIRVLQLSSLSLRAEEGSLFRGPPVTLSLGVKTYGYLLADNGYPPAEWMVVPYDGINQSVEQERFDNKQKVARGAVERAFGKLKGMWRLFLRTHKTNLETLPQQFTAVCILHNLLIEAGIPFDKNLLWEVGGNGV